MAGIENGDDPSKQRLTDPSGFLITHLQFLKAIFNKAQEFTAGTKTKFFLQNKCC